MINPETIEQVKAELPEYRRQWRQMAHDYLEELRPQEYRQLSNEPQELAARLNALMQPTEEALLRQLAKGTPLWTALEIAQGNNLIPVAEPEGWEEEYAEDLQIAVAEAWFHG